MRLRAHNPDDLLQRIKQDESHSRMGELKVYLGYAAGVGKTYAMLRVARQLKESGKDVVVGWVEAHGRRETESLVGDLEVLPRRGVIYKGISVETFDLDAALNRRPEILLVDEFAHSNLPESRHPKRYQDVLELVEAGIDVHTTLNVQHLESVNDVVRQITGVEVKETIPDRVLQQASQLSLVDITPEELLERLDQGKVYLPERAEAARESFFRRGNLLALREIAMREAAQRVDEEVRNYRQREAIEGAWPAGERLLVCVGPSPSSRRLVRAARRLADSLNASWVALHVSTSRISATERERIAQHLQFAESLGAEIKTVTDESVVEATARVANLENITKIVAGKPLGRRWQELLTGTLVDQILKTTRGLDVLVVGGDEAAATEPPPPKEPLKLRPYLFSALLVGLATFAGYPLLTRLDSSNQVLFYLAAVVCVAYLFGRGPAFATSLLSVFMFNFFFVAPRLTLRAADPGHVLTFLGLFLTGLFVSSLTSRAQDIAVAAKERESQALTLLEVSRDLSLATTRERIAKLAEHHLGNFLGQVKVLLATSDGPLPEESSLGSSEFAIADWAYRKLQKAGRGTSTLPGGRFQWHPLISGTHCLGVVGVSVEVHPGKASQAELLGAILSQVASALERLSLAETARETELLKATERLQTALLNSVSHDLRIPLVSINGALSSLLDPELSLKDDARRQMVENALSEADRLTRLVTNLLQMTRMESGVVEIRPVPCDPWDLVSTTVSHLGERLAGRKVILDLPEELPLVPMDYVLIQQVLTNLLENSLRHGQGEITVTARASDDRLEFTVGDQGQGVPEGLRGQIFERFYRGSHAADGGVGLGLSICKGLVEAHGGQIGLYEGRFFRFWLPLSTATNGDLDSLNDRSKA